MKVSGVFTQCLVAVTCGSPYIVYHTNYLGDVDWTSRDCEKCRRTKIHTLITCMHMQVVLGVLRDGGLGTRL